MQTECQFVTNGIYMGDDPGDNPRLARLRRGAADWQLLLQVDSDPTTGMTWGDNGQLYFWIRRQDLAARKFDQAWLICQSE